MKCASIDIGTNTALMLILECDGADREVLDLSSITRLGERVRESGRLSRTAIDRGLSVLRRYKEVIDRESVEEVFCVGTSALREASNSGLFLTRAREELGFEIRIISGRDEAYYTYLSVKGDPSIPGEEIVIVDIGGGSTEIIEGNREEFLNFLSMPVGTVKLTEMFVSHDPPLPVELNEMRSHVRHLLRTRSGDTISGAMEVNPVAPVPRSPDSPVQDRNCVFRANSGAVLVGAGGTVTNLAAIRLGLDSFDKERIHGLVMSLADVDNLVAQMTPMTTRERGMIPGMEKGREDIILQGTILLREIMEHLGARSLVVSTAGVRYGVLKDRTTFRPC